MRMHMGLALRSGKADCALFEMFGLRGAVGT